MADYRITICLFLRPMRALSHLVAGPLITISRPVVASVSSTSGGGDGVGPRSVDV